MSLREHKKGQQQKKMRTDLHKHAKFVFTILFQRVWNVDGPTWTTCWVGRNEYCIQNKSLVQLNVVCAYDDFAFNCNLLHVICDDTALRIHRFRYATIRRFSFTTNLLWFVVFFCRLCVNAVHTFSRHALVSFLATTTTTTIHQQQFNTA